MDEAAAAQAKGDGNNSETNDNDHRDSVRSTVEMRYWYSLVILILFNL